MEKAYILAWWKSGVELVGPFDNEDAAAEWAGTLVKKDGEWHTVANPNNPHDTPCWQVITLNETQFVADVLPIRVRTPKSGPLRDYV